MWNVSDVNSTEAAGPPPLNPAWALNPDEYDSIIFHEDFENTIDSWTSSDEFLPTIIVYSFTFLVGIVGNGLVIFALLGDKHAQSETNAFLVSLAIADLLFLLICIPYETISKISGYLPHGTVFCKLAGFVETFTAATSIWNLTFVSIERYGTYAYSQSIGVGMHWKWGGHGPLAAKFFHFDH